MASMMGREAQQEEAAKEERDARLNSLPEDSTQDYYKEQRWLMIHSRW